MKYFLIAIAIFAAVLAYQWSRPRVPLTDARKLVEAGATLLDVRTPQEFADGHVAGAINIPVDELSKRLEQLGARDRPVVVYCRSGSRSARATRVLERGGFKQVVDIGPMPSW